MGNRAAKPVPILSPHYLGAQIEELLLEPPEEMPRERQGVIGAARSEINAVYYPSWRIYSDQPPSIIPLRHVTHVYYAFAAIDGDGTLFFSDEYVDFRVPVDGTHGCLAAVTQLKRKQQTLKVILAVGGGTSAATERFMDITGHGNERKLGRFCDTARETLEKFGLDGLDVDWEHPSTAEEVSCYIKLLAALRFALPFGKYLLCTAVPAGIWALQNMAMSEVSKYVDLVNVMGYDFYGPWEGKAGHHAQLFSSDVYSSEPSGEVSCDVGLKYLLEQCRVPAEKILLGVPCYGRRFAGCEKIGDQVVARAMVAGADNQESGIDDDVVEYRNLPYEKSEVQYDRERCAAFIVRKQNATNAEGSIDSSKATGTEFISYDNIASVRRKAAYVKKAGLAGLFYWHVGLDKQGKGSLIMEGGQALAQFESIYRMERRA